MKNLLPEGFIINILEKFNIKYFLFRNTIKVKCPFHHDEEPSASIDPIKNTFICFVCKDNLYKKLGIKSNKIAISSYNLFKLLGGDEKEWKILVKKAFKAKKYMKKVKNKKEKINKEKIENIWKSLSTEQDIEIIKYLNKRKINYKKIKNEIKINKNKKNWPIAVPIYDINKNLTGIILKSIKKEIKPKAIMIPGSSLGFLGLKTLEDSKITIVVEGITDFLTAKSLGFKRVIGITSSYQNIPKEIIKYFTKTVIFFLHNDEPGIQLYKNIKNICDKNNIKIIAIRTSKEKGGDLNDFISKNKNSKVKLKNFLIKLLNGEINDPRKRKNNKNIKLSKKT